MSLNTEPKSDGTHVPTAVVRDTASPAATPAPNRCPGDGCGTDFQHLKLGGGDRVEIAPDGPNSKQTKCWTIATVLWIGVIFFSSTDRAGQWAEQIYSWIATMLARRFQAEVGSSNIVHFLAEKSFHVFLFVVLAVLLWNAVPSARRNPTLILFVGFVVGSCSEWLQRFQPRRDPSLRDVCINVAATAFGAVMSLLLFRPRRLNQRV